ncbi:hypothetical protein DICPUDRAFT_97819 [Dictyostelium purpureum]|uniref:t-SNARE coiled-coil homology domain-containing protein n=1 Tax=Dictyostelium purpureum TaxID=5786 RepID=F0ZK13_DICPU|nr:uncharacterized protein DICPUDRAFT_97819 [Dictyostelium purpureum]EGC35709.1 hypothetical protein DICPUDRAFT_97819 [Dictyostelium purpureum]|eukprot:XP_003287765.1 hypothetical protein DICPUDRAFT_97819 [Dictyostelium purpureum]
MRNENHNRVNPSQGYLSDNARNALFDGKDRRFNNNFNAERDVLSNQDILEQQRKQMDDQDKMLDALSGSVGRVKEIAITIDKTAQEHCEILDELDVQVDSTSARLRNTTKSLIHLTQEAKTTGYWGVICFLILVLIIVIVLAGAL